MPDLFKGGTLEMSTTPLPQPDAVQVWGDCVVNQVAVVVAVVLLVVVLSDLIMLFPQLMRCLSVWKGNLEIEHSISLARTRNTVALALVLPFCIIADRWGLIAPSFKLAARPEWQLLIATGLLSGGVLLRRLAYLISRFRSRTSEYACTVRNALYNYFILLITVMLVTAVLMVAFRASDAAVRIVLLVETGIYYLVHLIRTGQIFASRCGSFTTFLYLCALEFLPTGFLLFVFAL